MSGQASASAARGPPRQAGNMSHIEGRVATKSPKLQKSGAGDQQAADDRGRRLEHAANNPTGKREPLMQKENRIIAERKAAKARGQRYDKQSAGDSN